MTHKFTVQTASFENALVMKEGKLNHWKKHGLVEGNAVLIYNWFIHEAC